MAKNIRIKKKIEKKVEKKITFDMLTAEQRVELDRNMMDIVTKILFEDGHKDELDLQKEVIDKANVIFPEKEVERIWNVMIGSNWVSPIVGFGKAGKLELTNAGLQMMSQYGSYKNFLQKQEEANCNANQLPTAARQPPIANGPKQVANPQPPAKGQPPATNG